MNRQIEVKNMAEILCDARHKFVYSDELAEYLYNKGYRKSTDVAREIFAEIDKFLKSQEALSENKRLKEVGDWIFHDYLPSQLAELKKKYESEG